MSETLKYMQAINRIVAGVEMQSKEWERNGISKYTFLIGAGASISSHLPNGEELCKYIKKQYRKNLNKKNVNSEIETRQKSGMSLYQATMSTIFDLVGKDIIARHIRDLIIKDARRPEPDFRWIINNCYNILANISIEKPYFARTIFTTNFDPLLYYAFIQNWHEEPIIIRHYEELSTMLPIQVHKTYPCLIYLHGYWQNHELYLDFTSFEDNQDNWILQLNDWLLNDIIVIGYSGFEDNIALEWLRRCLRKGRTIWWCVYTQKDEISTAEVATIQNNLRIGTTNRLKFFPIKSSDQFALDLGEQLKLKKAKDINCVNKIFPWFKPISISQFINGAKLKYSTDKNLSLKFNMGNDSLPGNNHAGLNIDSVEHELDISDYKAIKIEYNVENTRLIGNSIGFEFKLHSINKGWSYHLPIKERTHNVTIDLNLFRKEGVDLSKIWRVVIAADVKCLGENGKAKISIKNTTLEK